LYVIVQMVGLGDWNFGILLLLDLLCSAGDPYRK